MRVPRHAQMQLRDVSTAHCSMITRAKPEQGLRHASLSQHGANGQVWTGSPSTTGERYHTSSSNGLTACTRCWAMLTDTCHLPLQQGRFRQAAAGYQVSSTRKETPEPGQKRRRTSHGTMTMATKSRSNRFEAWRPAREERLKRPGICGDGERAIVSANQHWSRRYPFLRTIALTRT